jgi:UDP-N-acetylmuramoyl-L-alanyl-D-glutamate--2,6-diaminopimelate ligase
MKWNKLWEGIAHMVLGGFTPVEVPDVCCLADACTKNGIFVCIKGTRRDGASYLGEALKKGCKVVVVDRKSTLEALERLDAYQEEQLCRVMVADCRKTYALLCRNLYGRPDEALCMVGITGTKGKTSTAGFLYQAFRNLGVQAGQIGTGGAIWGRHRRALSMTTPDAKVLYGLLSQMRSAGITHVVMEVSSQGLKQQRVCGIHFQVGAFTNLYPDHIGPGEHASMEEYFYWKCRLFDQCAVAVLPDVRTDEHAAFIEKQIRGRMPVYVVRSEALLKSEESVFYRGRPAKRLLFESSCGGAEHLLEMPGTFQVMNHLMAMTILRALKFEIPEKLFLKAIPGRMECVCVEDHICFYVDYAHNGKALKEALMSLRAYGPRRIICVFGCGGDRSRLRRGPMGAVSTTLADWTIITQDNSRSEDFLRIAEDIEKGIPEDHNPYEIMEERSLAIRRSVELAQPGDMVIIAGKGNEHYMEKGGVRTYFSDQKEVKRYVRICKYHH